MEKLTKRIWASFLLVGLVGQFAWTIENMYFNVFLYNTISADTNAIATMVAASAITATLTTLLMGALSDSIGKRKPLIVGGYLLWGLSTLAFGFITVENAAKWFPAANAVQAAAVMVIVMDCVMTFFGSTANDAAFNAYVTDVTTEHNRGRAESVLAILPLISMLIIFGAFDGMTQAGKWREFYLIFGGLVTVTGVIAAFLLKDGSIEKKNDTYFKNIIYGFRPAVIRQNGMLYLSLIAFMIFNIAVQVFFPYFIIYLQTYLAIDAYAVVLGIALVVASVASVAFGGVIDKVGKLKFVLPAAIVMLAGLVMMYFARGFWFVIVAGAIMMSGYMLVTAALSGTIRDYTPRDKIGHFQGIRMIFAVMLPMIIGPFIGSAVIKGSGQTYVELGVVKDVPTPAIFLAGAVTLLLVFVPVLLLRKKENR